MAISLMMMVSVIMKSSFATNFMGEHRKSPSHRSLRLSLKGKVLEVMQHFINLKDQETPGIPHENQVRTVGDATGRCSIMDDTSGSRGNLTKDMDMLG